MSSKMEVLAEARRQLLDHAIEFATGDVSDAHVQRRHLELADAYARARWAAATGSSGRKDRKPSTSSLTLPFGRSKGQTIGASPSGDLQWVAEALRTSVGDPAKARWRTDNQKLLAAIECELNQRGDA